MFCNARWVAAFLASLSASGALWQQGVEGVPALEASFSPTGTVPPEPTPGPITSPSVSSPPPAPTGTIDFCSIEEDINNAATVETEKDALTKDIIDPNATCTCTDAETCVRRLDDESDDAALLRGSSRRLDWGWYDSWHHYYCGRGVDVRLDTTGREDEIRSRWQSGGDPGGDGILDSLQRLICDEGETSGTCGGGDEADEDEDHPCLDEGLSRPSCDSDTFWIGGFALSWEVTSKNGGEDSCEHTVKLTFDDVFDPGFELRQLALIRYPQLSSCDLCGFKGEYHVKYTWYTKIVCDESCDETACGAAGQECCGLDRCDGNLVCINDVCMILECDPNECKCAHNPDAILECGANFQWYVSKMCDDYVCTRNAETGMCYCDPPDYIPDSTFP